MHAKGAGEASYAAWPRKVALDSSPARELMLHACFQVDLHIEKLCIKI
jgi:hypothetical protein